MADAENSGQRPGGEDDSQIDLTFFDKAKRLVSSDEEWEAHLLKKMEEKRNRGTGAAEAPPAQSKFNFSVEGIVGKIKSFIPLPQQGGAGGGSTDFPGEMNRPTDQPVDLERSGDELVESQ